MTSLNLRWVHGLQNFKHLHYFLCAISSHICWLSMYSSVIHDQQMYSISLKYHKFPDWWLRCCYTRQFLLQLVSQFCCDTSCALRYRLLESCYTRQRFSVILEAVVSSAAILSWNKTSRAQKEQFDWPMPLNVATQIAGKVLHCATWEKFLAMLRNVLQKVELTSTFRNDCSNKKIVTNVCSRVCYTRQYFVQLVSQQNCETSCKRNCLV